MYLIVAIEFNGVQSDTMLIRVLGQFKSSRWICLPASQKEALPQR